MILPFPTLQLMLALVLVVEAGLMRSRLSRDVARTADRGTLRALFIVIFSSVGLAWLAGRCEPQARFEPLLHLGATAMRATLATGFLLFVAGLALRWTSVIHLGRWFTYDVAIAADHRVVDSGPYRTIRHPAYAGSLLTFLGLGICGGNALALAVLVTPIALAFLYRMRIEEAAMASSLAGYDDYMRRTKRLVPFVY